MTGSIIVNSSYCKFFSSSIGRKMVVSLTGLALSLFLLMHMAGNLIVLMSIEKFNQYALNLESMGLLLYLAEVGLVSIFLLHIYMAIRLTMRNRAARPDANVLRADTERSRRTWGSSHMLLSGFVILLFVIYHLKQFKFAGHEILLTNGVQMRNLGKTVIGEFHETQELIIYLVALTFITLHLRHGFRSLFDTLGIVNTKWDPIFRWFSVIYVYAVMGGFFLIPLWIYFGVSP
jgi:succinate dehydrogenase / fumarate reductase cytochrome b subunit